MKLFASIDQGMMLPKFHGVVVREWETNKTQTAIFPLNWIVAIWYNVRAYCLYGTTSMSIDPRVAFHQGYQARIDYVKSLERPDATR